MLPREGQHWCLKTKHGLDAYKKGRWPKPEPFSKYSEDQEWRVDYAPIHQNLDDCHRDILAIRDKLFEMTTPPSIVLVVIPTPAVTEPEETSNQEEEGHEIVPNSIQDNATIGMVKIEEGDSSHQESTPFTRGELKNASTVGHTISIDKDDHPYDAIMIWIDALTNLQFITGISSPIDIVLYVVRQFQGIIIEWWESCDEERVNKVALGGLMTLREELFDEFVPNHTNQQNQAKSLLLKMKCCKVSEVEDYVTDFQEQIYRARLHHDDFAKIYSSQHKTKPSHSHSPAYAYSLHRKHKKKGFCLDKKNMYVRRRQFAHDLSSVECYAYHKKGHYAQDYPKASQKVHAFFTDPQAVVWWDLVSKVSDEECIYRVEIDDDSISETSSESIS
eukprot:Gb_13464 [translate_table: standard]